MGKKRRLNSAKLKFNAKHRNHPRAKLLAQKAQPAIPPETRQEPEIEPEEPKVEVVAPEVVLKPIEPEIAVKVASPSPKVKKTKAPRKKKASTPRKRTSRKKTTSASA